MNRNFLLKWYETPKGLQLQEVEANFLRRSITVGCKQVVLQIGALGWENRYIDCTLYRQFIITDAAGLGTSEARKVAAHPDQLPFQCDSADMIILPHMLEFAADQHQVLREAERVLKPEGRLVVLNFNPWSWYVRYQYCLHREKHDSKLGRFITRTKIVDWMKLLNFEVEIAAGFNFKTLPAQSLWGDKCKHSPWVAAYAVKAVKRRYTMIPLPATPIKTSRLAVAGVIEAPNRWRES